MRKWFSIVCASALLLGGCTAAEEDPEPVPVVAVRVAQARTTDFIIQVSSPATVYPREQVDVASRLTAPIRELPVQAGDRVAAGEILAQLEDRDLAAQLAEAQATLREAEATLEKVSAGTLPADLERAEGQVRASQAALDLAQSNYDRRRGLYDQGAIPQRDLIASQTELAQAQATADVARAELRLLEEQAGVQDVEIARSRRDQARSRVDLLEAQFDFARIRSSIDGVITEQFLFQGDMAGPANPIFTVVDMSTAIARAQVPETEARGLRVGQACSLSPADMPHTAVDGVVTVVNAGVDVRRRTVEVWCAIRNADGAIRAGVFGTVTVTTGTEANAVVVPVAAVQRDEGSTGGFAMVVTSDNVVEERPVVTGSETNGMIQIISGLSGNETVVVEGGFGLPDGTRVEASRDSQ
jgi:HlyD family secretion protein